MCKCNLLCRLNTYLLFITRPGLFIHRNTGIFIYIFYGICNILPDTVIIIIINYISYIYALFGNQICNIRNLHFSQLFCIQRTVFCCKIKYKYSLSYRYIVLSCKFIGIRSIFKGLIHNICLYIICI